MSRGRRLLLDGNTKGYEVAEYISTKVEVNPRMLSTLKNEKPGLFQVREIFWKTFHENFSCHKFYPDNRAMTKAIMNKLREIFLIGHRQFGQ